MINDASTKYESVNHLVYQMVVIWKIGFMNFSLKTSDVMCELVSGI